MTLSIEVRHLGKRFGPVTAVDDVSFEVAPGRVTGFLGPNGAGKTTTLRMLLGLVTPASGTAAIGGRPYRQLACPLRKVGVVLESSGAHPGRTARNHLRLQAMLAGVSPARAEEVLALTGLADAGGRRAGGFSLGMRQRLGLATALIGDPAVLILDEPANGLDPDGVRWLRELLRRLAGEGRTVLVSSHLLAEAAQTVDEVIILDRGRLIAHAPLSERPRRPVRPDHPLPAVPGRHQPRRDHAPRRRHAPSLPRGRRRHRRRRAPPRRRRGPDHPAQGHHVRTTTSDRPTRQHSHRSRPRTRTAHPAHHPRRPGRHRRSRPLLRLAPSALTPKTLAPRQPHNPCITQR